MSKSAQGEVNFKFASKLGDESLPHKSSGSVVREGEVDGFVKELFKFLLIAFLGFACAADNCNAGIFSHPLSFPFRKSTFYAIRASI
jgi:hypothetical protein